MVRNANAGDIPVLIELGERIYIESRYSQNSPFDEEECAELARTLISSPAGCLLVAEKEGSVIGWLAGGIAEQWFSRQLMAFKYGLFIAPEYRSGTAGLRLTKAFIVWVKNHGATLINMEITTDVHEERTGDLYSRLCLQRSGLLYLMGI